MTIRWSAVLVPMLLILTRPQAASADPTGFRLLSVAHSPGHPIDIALWYPSSTPAVSTSLGMIHQQVAVDGPLPDRALPLVLISHGTGGWYGDFSELARSLAAAGLMVAALTHPGDNFREGHGSTSLQAMIDRPRHITVVLDYLLNAWPEHTHIDGARVGIFGFSAGAFTGLVVIGGNPDWTLFATFCSTHPTEGVCAQGGARFLSSSTARDLPASTWQHDRRVRAAVLAAPGFAFAFDKNSLAQISIPVQLWGGAHDSIVPLESNGNMLQRVLPHAVDSQVVPGATHFAFLPACDAHGDAPGSPVCVDAPGFDRSAFQKRFIATVTEFFSTQLAAGR